MKKWLVVGIILLFLTIGFSPIINANDNPVHETIDRVPITILEYKADGTVERTVFRMSPEQADTFHEEMRNAQDLEMRLSIYKKYNLISQDVTVDSLRTGMGERAQRMGLTQDDLISQFRSNRSLFLHVYRNIFCSISGYTFGGTPILIPFGTKWLRPLFDRETRVFEIIDFIIGELDVSSKGLLGEFGCHSITLKMVGFVGVMYYFWHQFYGFTMDGFCVYFKSIAIY
jgi:hypothetical protein